MQDNGELSSQRHPRIAITRSPGDGVPLILQTRGSLEPGQDHDSGLVQQSPSECVTAPRNPAAAIDFARLILSQRKPEMRAYGSGSAKATWILNCADIRKCREHADARYAARMDVQSRLTLWADGKVN